VSKFPKYISFFWKKKKNCKDLGVGQDLTKFTKIPTLESLFFFKKKMDILGMLIGFNRKS
jgi:hypothetical protein